MATPLLNNPYHGGHDIKILVDVSLVIMTKYLIYFSDHCSSVDKKRRRNIECSQYCHAPTQEPMPLRGGGIMELMILIVPSLVMSISDHCLGVEKKFFLKCIFTI